MKYTIILQENELPPIKSNGKLIENFERAEECIRTNYYGAKTMVDAFVPLLLLSPLPRIVNVSSLLGKIKVHFNFLSHLLITAC